MVPAGFFRVSLPDKAIFIKILITNGKQLRLKQSSSPIHIVLQHPMPESRKLPAAQYETQYTTAQNIRLSVINPLCYPAAGKECPHFRSNKKIRVAWGFKKLYDDMPARISRAIHLNLEAIFNHSPYYRYRNQKLGLTPKQQECIRQVCRKHGWKEEIQFDRYTEEYDW